jgi:hypothetical protein
MRILRALPSPHSSYSSLYSLEIKSACIFKSRVCRGNSSTAYDKKRKCQSSVGRVLDDVWTNSHRNRSEQSPALEVKQGVYDLGKPHHAPSWCGITSCSTAMRTSSNASVSSAGVTKPPTPPGTTPLGFSDSVDGGFGEGFE